MIMELKPIDRTDRARSRTAAALAIYRETILPEAQNPERQILYWIDHSRGALGDEFRCFAIQRGRQVIGYLQYSYFREEHVFFFEYLCIRDKQQRGLVPSSALRSIEDYLAQNYRPGFTIVFEVAQKRTASGIWEPDKKLMGYFDRLGFRSVDFRYRYPILQSYDGEASFPADLMVRLPDGRTSVTSSEMRTILRSIYFKHYLRWDRPFLAPDRFGERERLINELYSKQVAEIGRNDSFGTNGDDKRSRLSLFTNQMPAIGALVDRIFGPRLPRLISVIVVMLITQRFLGSSWLLLIFIPSVGAIYCLAEDTNDARKLAAAIIGRFKIAQPRS
jgi:hypothetical protein